MELLPRRLSQPLFSFSLSSCGSLLCALTSISHTRHIFLLGLAISNLSPSSPQACACIPSVPSNPTLTTRTHTYYTAHTTHASIFFAFILFPSYCITVSSVVISICAPFFIPGSFRSFCPNYSFFFCFLALFCLSFLSALAFVISSICALSSFSRHIALLDSHYLE